MLSPVEPSPATALSACDGGEARGIRAYYFELLADLLAPAPRRTVVDKHPLRMARMPIVHRLFPDAKIIFVERHPCDAVLSCFMANFQLNQAMRSFTMLDEAARTYDAVFDAWTRAEALLPLNVHRVRYERMVEIRRRDAAAARFPRAGLGREGARQPGRRAGARPRPHRLLFAGESRSTGAPPAAGSAIGSSWRRCSPSSRPGQRRWATDGRRVSPDPGDAEPCSPSAGRRCGGRRGGGAARWWPRRPAVPRTGRGCMSCWRCSTGSWTSPIRRLPPSTGRWRWLPRKPGPRGQRARLHAEAGRPALQLFDRALVLAPGDPAARFGRVSAMLAEHGPPGDRGAGAGAGRDAGLGRGPQAGRPALADGRSRRFARALDQALAAAPRMSALGDTISPA